MRATNAQLPHCHILDIRRKKLTAGLSQDLIDAIRVHTGRDNQVLIFLNRRGFAPSLMCHNCGWVAGCRHCDARMTLHRQPSRLHCHHCNSPQSLPSNCPQCKGNHLVSVGVGTEQVEIALKEILPDIGIVRIDRDNTQRKGSIEKILTSIHERENHVLIGTQMLAKGHHFPDVTLVAIVDMDGGLFSSDFRAAEHMAQLLMQVAGRAGRAEKPGEVVIQTRNPDHPLLLKLVHEGYASFAAESLRERKAANLPPFSYLALIRAEAEQQTSPLNFLDEVRKMLEDQCGPGIHLLGPIPSPMEKRAGFFRAQLLIQAQHRPTLKIFLPKLITIITQLKSARKIRWSLDVDPLEIF
jgi:primosomal protein N' (replication factor Y) (superfamily II helicase)